MTGRKGKRRRACFVLSTASPDEDSGGAVQWYNGDSLSERCEGVNDSEVGERSGQDGPKFNALASEQYYSRGAASRQVIRYSRLASSEGITRLKGLRKKKRVNCFLWV